MSEDRPLSDEEVMAARPRGAMTVAEAGRLGGEKRKQEMSPEEYSKIGTKGGATTNERYGKDYYSRIGRIGGRKVSQERGAEYYRTIGKAGGTKAKEMLERGKRLEEAEG